MNKNIKIAIFPSNASRDSVITTNGIALDNICTSCTVDESVIDGGYPLDATFLIDKETNLHTLIENEKILKVTIDYGYEVFRIVQTRKTPHKIEVVARQFTIAETLNLWLDDVRPTEQSGQGCLSHLLSNAIGVKDIFIYSDITTVNTAYYQNMNLYNALHSADNCFMARWGGEVQRRGYNLYINSRVGTNRKVIIRSKKNLTGFESNTDTNKLVTRIKPIGFNGITINGYVDSPLINSYSRVYTTTIKYDDVKVATDNDTEGFSTLAEAQEELIRRAKLEFTKNKVDELRADYRINFIQLEKTEEYKDYIKAERVYLGDTITVIEDTLGVEIKVRALKRKYDILGERVIEVELSNIPLTEKKAPSINQVLKQIKTEISGTNNSMADYIQSMINSGCTDSYVLYRQNEILLMDSKDINSAINVTRLNKNGLAFSQTGYYGTYSYGFTIDGKINASHITTGVLTAILIQSLNGSSSWDLISGLLTISDKTKSKIMKLYNGLITFNDQIAVDFKPQYVGQDWGFAITDLKDPNYFDYILVAPSNLKINHKEWIRQQVQYGTDENKHSYNMITKVNSAMGMEDIGYLEIAPSQVILNKNGQGYIRIREGVLELWRDEGGGITIKNGNLTLSANTTLVTGSHIVVGDKSCVQETINYGNRLFYSVEDGQSFLTETGQDIFTVVKTESGTYERTILINQIYKECVNLDIHYDIEIYKYGWGDYRIKERTKDYFILESNREDFTFNYCIKAKRKGFEENNLKECFITEQAKENTNNGVV